MTLVNCGKNVAGRSVLHIPRNNCILRCSLMEICRCDINIVYKYFDLENIRYIIIILSSLNFVGRIIFR